MQIDRKLIESSLRKKGFIEEKGPHKYFYHEVEGKRTGATLIHLVAADIKPMTTRC